MAKDANYELTKTDLNRATSLVTQMMAIPGQSGEEQKIVRFIIDRLRRDGVPASAIKTDKAHKRSPIGGQIGNLVVKLPGTAGMTRQPRRMIMAHVDTVSICVGAKPVRRGNRIVSADPATGLGADDRGGAAVVLLTALHVLGKKLPHPPLTLFWPVQEECGLHGVHYGDVALLGKPKLAFNYDGGSCTKLTVGATGAYRLSIDIDGRAAHAGVAPQLGVSAITIAAKAIADLHRGGWLGLIDKRASGGRAGSGGGRGTSNIGYINAGGATNVITNHAHLRAEVRSHDPKFRKRILDTFCRAFQDAAKQVRSVLGQTGRVRIDHELDYESFVLSKNDPSVLAAEAAIGAIGEQPFRDVVNGGVDANWLVASKIPTVTLGLGQENPHTVDEALNIHTFHQACRIALLLATGRENG